MCSWSEESVGFVGVGGNSDDGDEGAGVAVRVSEGVSGWVRQSFRFLSWSEGERERERVVSRLVDSSAGALARVCVCVPADGRGREAQAREFRQGTGLCCVFFPCKRGGLLDFGALYLLFV